MSEIIETVRLIQVNPNANSNKHWSGTLYNDGTYYAEWGRVGAKGQSGWLFICDFAMGKEYFPKRYGFSSLPSGYDSTQALPSNTGLHNHEAIVYDNHQVNIKYLIETN